MADLINRGGIVTNAQNKDDVPTPISITDVFDSEGDGVLVTDLVVEVKEFDLGEKGLSGHKKTVLGEDNTKLTADSTLIDASSIQHTADET
jgi:hypothetical protein